MRLLFFVATVASTLSFCIGGFALIRSRSILDRERVGILPIFSLLCLFLGLGTLASAFFVSAPSLEAAYFWFDSFAFNWYLAPPLFLLLALKVAHRDRLPVFIYLVFVPGILLSLVQAFIPRAVVSSISLTSLGWHVFYDFGSVWHWINVANYSLTILSAAAVLALTSFKSTDKRRALQSRAMLIAILPTYFGGIFLGLIVRFFGIEDLPPMLPVFIPLLVVGLVVALFRYDILNLGAISDTGELFSGIFDVVVICDLHGNIVDTNLGGTRHQGGRAADDLRGKPLRYLLPDLDAEEDWLRAKGALGIAESEMRFSFEPGKARLATVSVRCLGSDRGPVLGYVLSVHDLSIEKRLESEIEQRLGASKALRQSEERFSRLFRLNSAGMALATREGGQVRDVNEEFLRISGYEAAQALGCRLDQFFSGPDNKGFEDLLVSLDNGVPSVSAELQITRGDGQEVWCLAGVAALDYDEQPALLLTLLDITELHRLRNEVDKTQRLESIGLLAGGLAHDFNNILTAILGNVSLARMSVEDGGEVWELLGNAETSCFRARDLSYQLLTFAKGGSPNVEPLELLPIVREAVRMAVAGTSVVVSFSSDPALPNVLADSSQMVQVVSNLALNAVQAMEEKGLIKIRLWAEEIDSTLHASFKPEWANLKPGTYVCMSIEDNGPGIPDALKTRVFEPYISSKKKGSGLGLSICYSIVKRHGGSISVENGMDGGSLFTVCLPSCQDVPRVKTREPLRMGKGRILVMDDELSIRVTAKRMLERLGYEVVTASEGKEAIELFSAAKKEGRGFSVVILDLTIPGGMGGVEAAKTLREMDSAVVLYVSSGYSDIPVLSNYQAYSFDGVIGKPYGIEELSSKLSPHSESNGSPNSGLGMDIQPSS